MSSMAVVSSFISVTQNPNLISLHNRQKPQKIVSFTVGNGKGKTFSYSSSSVCGGSVVKAKFEFPSKSGGSSVLERPGFDQSQFDTMTQAEEGMNQ